MGRQIVIQPDGRLAVWSSIVDDFTDYNASPEEIIEQWAKDERDKIETMVNKTVSELKTGGKPYFQFTKTFEECIETIEEVHGKDCESLKLFSTN
tara:strand:+ start:747 stop:1031 length:285 start_codon:yes stop_codon:yes gene_type:complete